MAPLDTFFGNASSADSGSDFPQYWEMQIRAIVAANVQTLIDYARDRKQPFSDQKSLAKAAGVSMSTIARIRKQEAGTSVDVLESIAKCYGLQAWQLLMPNLDPTNPPVFCMTATERDLYRNLKSAAATIAAIPNHSE
jgi:transcriptional regulator with XRE-family HTH domain